MTTVSPRLNRHESKLRRLAWVAQFLAVTFATLAPASGVEPNVSLVPRPRWTNLLADREVVFVFEVASPEGFQGDLLLVLVANGRTLAGARAVVKADDAKPVQVELRLKAPPLAEGVVFSCELAAQLFREKNREVISERRWPAWLFAADPFHDQRKWLEKLDIALWDPDGATAKVLQATDVPLTLIAQRRLLESRMTGVLLVGEGIDLQSDRAMVQTLLDAAKRGVCVICLAPIDGRFPLADFNAQDSSVKRWTMQREEIITQLDKRLDSSVWSRDGKMAISGMVFAAERGQVVLQVDAVAPAAFPWLEVQFPAEGGRLIICGWGIVRHWDATPTPRYFLKKLLETVVVAAKTELPPED